MGSLKVFDEKEDPGSSRIFPTESEIVTFWLVLRKKDPDGPAPSWLCRLQASFDRETWTTFLNVTTATVSPLAIHKAANQYFPFYRMEIVRIENLMVNGWIGAAKR